MTRKRSFLLVGAVLLAVPSLIPAAAGAHASESPPSETFKISPKAAYGYAEATAAKVNPYEASPHPFYGNPNLTQALEIKEVEPCKYHPEQFTDGEPSGWAKYQCPATAVQTIHRTGYEPIVKVGKGTIEVYAFTPVAHPSGIYAPHAGATFLRKNGYKVITAVIY